MSYALAIAGDARIDLRSLDSWLQEAVWDQLESIASDPSRMPPPSADDDITFEFSFDAASVRHFFAMSLGKNDVTHTITLLGVAHRQIPLDP